MAKISTFIIGMVVVSLFAGTLMLALSQFANNYDISDNYDNTSLQSYNRLRNLTIHSEEIKNQTENIQDKDPSVKDIIGGYFSSGYQALSVTAESVDTFEEMTGQAVSDSSLGAAAPLFRSAALTIIIIIIFIGCIVAAIMKWGI